MTVGTKLNGYLLALRDELRSRLWPRNSGIEEPPLRSELFSADQLEQHGKALAASHSLAKGRSADRLLARLADNENTLVDVCNLLSAAASTKRRVTPAGEWLLDNFYLIEEQIRTAKRHLPKGYSLELPRLAHGPSAGHPRVYDIALETIAHGDGRVDSEGLSRFVASYQTVTPLNLGELWAIPIMLRLAVIENLRRVAMRIAAGWTERNLANSWADQMLETAEKDPNSLILVIADMARSGPPMISPFVAELARRLQGRGPALALPLTWIEHRLSEVGLTIEQMVRSEAQQQAASQVSVRQSIGSLRLLGAIDWRDFVENHSVVERVFREDPAGVYRQMDFATRDRYRHATERIAKRGRMSETEVAGKAVELARAGVSAGSESGTDERRGHVGFYLIDKGLAVLEQAAEVQLSAWDAVRAWGRRAPLFLYLGGSALIMGLLAWTLVGRAQEDGAPDWALGPIAVLALLFASQVAVALVNWLATLLVTPHLLPRMDFATGIPRSSRTLVVVPTLLMNEQGIEDLVEALEVRFLANPDDRLHFALVTDLKDADRETLPDDAALMALAQHRIEELNQKYLGGGKGRGDTFFLFHRPRKWNAQERVWMGYERKRGKLEALNRMLRGGGAEAFTLVVGDTSYLKEVKYVITLDTDTQLPRDAARQFVATMAHPLNRPLFDAAKQRVVEGYGILQPRVSIGLPGTNRSLYARLCGGEPGLDPYTRAVSDVYQDVFGEGSFIGKGIYDVDAFELAVHGRFPENRILSHDLIEGCHARAGLLSDVQLYEDCPARYSADVSRRHRWIRGDWQLVPWLFRKVFAKSGEPGATPSGRQKNPLSTLSQWKLIDNLRRSLVPVALTLLLLLGWILPFQSWFWTFWVIFILLLPALCAFLLDLFRKPANVLSRQHLATTARSASRHLLRLTLDLAFLPYEAFFTLDAIVRTGWRMLITRRRLLEWNPSSEANRESEKGRRGSLLSSFFTMWVGPAVALLVTAYLAASNPGALAGAAPILALWLASPAIAWWISRPLVPHKPTLTEEQTLFLRSLSRRTWAFFDAFVGPQDHWLPPDNFQASRVETVAHRTSPTNIGLSLLANLSAYDFGYISAGKLLERTANSLETMDKMAKHRGHFYNWYDTQTLEPLPPLYVSSVDSGNLAGHLLTLRAGLLGIADDLIPGGRLLEGLSDTLSLIETGGERLTLDETAAFRAALDEFKTAPPWTLSTAQTVLERLTGRADQIAVRLAESALSRNASRADLATEQPAVPPLGEAREWAEALGQQCRDALADLSFVAPWLAMAAPPPGLEEFVDLAAPRNLRGLAQVALDLHGRVQARLGQETSPTKREWLSELLGRLAEGSARATERLSTLESLARRSGDHAQMDFGFLFDRARHLLTVGYNVSDRRADASYYDLLASEARFSTFVGIAQGQLPQESWFTLGRLLTSTGGDPVLLSWSGSMFEYLMPLLVMPTFEGTLLDQTYKAAVERQIEYGRQRDVPWGMSESGYNTVDAHLNYQYRAFGVPGLGLKRGLAEDLVIAPYATALALMVLPEEACSNLQRMEKDGFLGKFGFFEAIDYTQARQQRGKTLAVVQAYMAHHQGMSLLALAYLLLGRPMQKRFESDRLFQATMLLLHERVPKATTLFSLTAQLETVRSRSSATETPIRLFNTPDTEVPEVQLLSNGRYHVMVTNAGGGYSRYKDLAVTRWHEDGTRDHWGTFCYIRERASGTFWSPCFQPTLQRPESYEAIFSEARAEFRRRDVVGDDDAVFETHTEIVVSPEDDIELRRVRITNKSRQRREIDVTSYAEVVIAPPATDAAHPAFSNLFVQTEIVPERRAILCTRRSRSHDEPATWMFHLMAVHGAQLGEVSFETDRLRFIGRTRSTRAPQAMVDQAPLSGTAGSVLDPVVAIRSPIVLNPGQTATFDIVSGMASSREKALNLVEKYQDLHLADRVFELTWTHSQVVLRQLNSSEAESQVYARLAGSVIFANPSLRADAKVLIRNRRGQSGLWGYAISGDLPIVLLQIGEAANIDLVRQLVQAHAYWRLKGLAVDLVIWNEDRGGYLQQLQDQIMGFIASGIEASVIDRPGGIFVRPAAQISPEDRILLLSVARAVITDGGGSLLEQLDHDLSDPRPPKLTPTRSHKTPAPTGEVLKRSDLILHNGLGGFTADGTEYVITLSPGQVTPAPWVNVLANPQFGTVISESGSAYTWSENAHEFRLTPWHNDPVTDSSGEAIYLRDEDTGHVWSPTPSPSRVSLPYLVRHGFGYSVFETRSAGIRSELWVYVAMDASIKFSVLKVRNDSGHTRKLSATGYVEWVLGDLRAKSAMHVTTEVDPHTGALFARNPYNAGFADRVAFLDVDEPTRNLTGDRKEFLGRNGNLQNPAAMSRARLSGKVGAALDPCGAIQVAFDLAPGQQRDIIFRLGIARNAEKAVKLVERFRGVSATRAALDGVWKHWKHTLGAVQIETPDASVNVLTNGWLVYQTLSCRVWARSGYYQSGGAFGFRDQLQDVMALVHTKAELLREQLLLCASRQFPEGDVQHWWHPPSGQGVRTHCSDDYLWLPLAACRYVLATGDIGVLDEPVHFLEGRPVKPEDDSYYDLPNRSPHAASLYEHCVRAIRYGLRFGEHGLPLMGSGDWNDGMNLVGLKGKGESVWLGFFLCEVLKQFTELARLRGDEPFAEHCREEQVLLRANLHRHAWDGDWYRRAYFDDGTPLGSAANTECRIDSISQSWSVLSGAGDPVRARLAMNAVDSHLVRREESLVQLLDPPFDKSAMDPGYIRGYVPGVRENGGQYTHAAIWTAMAFAALGDRKRAWELLTMINPVNHALSLEAVGTYKVEPYVVAADVYAVKPHTGRGGWTWYTGSAGWMYRLIVESLLGLKLESGNKLRLSPVLPADWTSFKIRYRYRETLHHIVVSQVKSGELSREMTVTMDGQLQPDRLITLAEDGRDHQVEVTMPAE